MLHRLIIQSDIEYIAENMRPADRMEVAAASGLTPLEVLEQGVELSTDCLVYTARNGEPLFIVGVVEPGIIWLLGTEGIRYYPHSLSRLAKTVLTEWHKRWPRLTNIVDARNTVHIRWLKSMGFQFGEPIIAGVAQIPFIPFFRELNV